MMKNHGGGVYPFTKINSMGERLTRSAVCTSSVFRSLRALPGERRVLARRGWTGETVSSFNILRALTAHVHFLGVGT